ncbi:hypothetical protein [Prosthecobacter sp.]|uniref:hypothetical protein n=1 Tax=Prosthecobacter sp. TaxID=1965333 RepID=UPI003784AD61
MNRPQKLAALMPLIHLAAEHAPALPPAQRADIYEGIQIASERLDRSISEEARRTAAALREAETLQLTFATLLRQSTPVTPRP